MVNIASKPLAIHPFRVGLVLVLDGFLLGRVIWWIGWIPEVEAVTFISGLTLIASHSNIKSYLTGPRLVDVPADDCAAPSVSTQSRKCSFLSNNLNSTLAHMKLSFLLSGAAMAYKQWILKTP